MGGMKGYGDREAAEEQLFAKKVRGPTQPGGRSSPSFLSPPCLAASRRPRCFGSSLQPCCNCSLLGPPATRPVLPRVWPPAARIRSANPLLAPRAQEDEKALRKLLSKMKKQAEEAEPAAAAEAQQEEIAALKPIIDKYRCGGLGGSVRVSQG